MTSIKNIRIYGEENPLFHQNSFCKRDINT